MIRHELRPKYIEYKHFIISECKDNDEIEKAMPGLEAVKNFIKWMERGGVKSTSWFGYVRIFNPKRRDELDAKNSVKEGSGFGWVPQLDNGDIVIYEGNPHRAIIYRDGKSVAVYHVRYFQSDGVRVMCPDFNKPFI